MAKTRFTELRLERLQKQVEFEMYILNNQISGNITAYEKGERPAHETRKRHERYSERMDCYIKIYHMAIHAANRIDGVEKIDDRHYATKDYVALMEFYFDKCAYFRK